MTNGIDTSVELPRMKTPPALDDMSWQEFALDDDAILCDIPSEPSGPHLPSDPDHVPCELQTLMGLSHLSMPPETPVSAYPIICTSLE